MATPTKRVDIPARKVQRGVGKEHNVQTEILKVVDPAPARKVQRGVGNSGSNVRLEPLDHLIQHIKQYDARLYEALKRLSDQQVTNLETTAEQAQQDNGITVSQQDKVTFGLVKTLQATTGLTLYYVCRKKGSWVDFVAKVKDQAPTGAAAILDVMRSVDDGVNWVSIFPVGNSSKIVLPVGSTATVTIKKFAVKEINPGDLLRIDCLQTGSVDAGKGIEVVGRWASNSLTNP